MKLFLLNALIILGIVKVHVHTSEIFKMNVPVNEASESAAGGCGGCRECGSTGT